MRVTSIFLLHTISFDISTQVPDPGDDEDVPEDNSMAPTPTQVPFFDIIWVKDSMKLTNVYVIFQQPSQVMKCTLVRPLRSGAKKCWLLDDDHYLYKRNGDYKAGTICI
jgi:hypothetical protein